jgi:hypothetical protein
LGHLGGVHRSGAGAEVGEETAKDAGRLFDGGKLNLRLSHLGDTSSPGGL